MSDGEFGRDGWILVGLLVVAFFLIPGLIIALPGAREEPLVIGLTFRDAYLVLPLVPAFVLALVAVWVAIRSRRPE
jgi:hypothetical protein